MTWFDRNWPFFVGVLVTVALFGLPSIFFLAPAADEPAYTEEFPTEYLFGLKSGDEIVVKNLGSSVLRHQAYLVTGDGEFLLVRGISDACLTTCYADRLQEKREREQ